MNGQMDLEQLTREILFLPVQERDMKENNEPIAVWDTTTWYESPRWAVLTLSGAHDGEPIAVAVREPYIGSDGDEDGNSFPVVEWTGSIKLADRVTDLSDDLCDAYADAICTALMAMASD